MIIDAYPIVLRCSAHFDFRANDGGHNMPKGAAQRNVTHPRRVRRRIHERGKPTRAKAVHVNKTPGFERQETCGIIPGESNVQKVPKFERHAAVVNGQHVQWWQNHA